MKRILPVFAALVFAVSLVTSAAAPFSVGIDQSMQPSWQDLASSFEAETGIKVTLNPFPQSSLAQQIVLQAFTRSGKLNFITIPEPWASSLMGSLLSLGDVEADLRGSGVSPVMAGGRSIGVPVSFADGWILAVLAWPDDRDAAVQFLIAAARGSVSSGASSADPSKVSAQSVVATYETGKIAASSHNPKLDGALESLIGAAQATVNAMAAQVLTGLPPAATRAIENIATLFGVPYNADTGTVTVVLESRPGRSSSSNVAALSALGVGRSSIEASTNLVKVTIPVGELSTLAAQLTGVAFIRPPYKPHPLGTSSQGVGSIGADAFHAQGITGTGVKIAIIDLGFSGLSQAQSRGDLPYTVTQNDLTGTGLTSGISHGTAVAEVVYDIAPNAQLYLIKIGDEVDLDTAVTYCLNNGIDIINHSLGWYNTNFYDGTGTIADIAKRAISGGILWVNAAGNEAESHWEGPFSDANSDGWHDQTLSFYASSGSPITLYLTWNEWPQSSTDYDLYLYDPTGGLVASSTKNQTGTEEPTESIQSSASQSGTYTVRFRGVGARTLELYNLYQNLSPSVASSSILAPANVSEVVTVGAIDYNNYTTGPQEPYSSQGPTNDGRTKPDLMCPDNVSTGTAPYTTFPGTSGATPHAAGAAALLLAEQPSLTEPALRAALLSNTIPMGSSNIYGRGRLVLQAPGPSNQSPVASFTFSPTSPTAGSSVSFNATGSSDSDGYIVSYAWTFGDGGTGTGMTASHTYSSAATYTVRLTVTDNEGATGTTTRTVSVGSSPNQSPVASFSFSPSSPLAGTSVSFNGTGSYDPDGSIVSYSWAFGDGSTASGTTTSHVYSSPGTYTARLTVTDNRGATGTTTRTVSVGATVNQPPTASFTVSPSTAQPGAFLFFDASASFDPDGTIVSYAWDFGDGMSASGTTTYHQFSSAGNYTVTLTVRDDDGASGTTTRQVSIQAPATADLVVQNLTYTPANPATGQSITFSFTVRNQGTAAAGQFRVLLSGATSSTSTYVSNLAAGGSRSLSLSLPLTASSETFTVRADDQGQVAESNEGNNAQSVTITATAAAPVADADGPYSGVVGSPIQFTGSGSSGSISTYLWSFGDGTSAQGISPSHAYSSPGTYTASLTVSGPGGQSTDSTQVSVSQPQPALSVLLSLPKTSYQVNESIVVNFTTNRPAYVYLCEVTADNRVVLLFPNLYESNPYVGSGTHAVPSGGYTMRVTEPAGSETLYLFAATSQIPGFPTSFGAGFPVLSTNPSGFRNSVISAMQSIAPNGEWSFDTLSFNVVAAPPTTGTLQVNSSPSGAAVRLDGSSIGNTPLQRTNVSPGVHTVEVSRSGYQTETRQVNVVAGTTTTIQVTLIPVPSNQAPTASFTYTPASPTVGNPVQFDGSGSHDPDGSITSYAWSFGDGGTASGAVVSHAFSTNTSFDVRLTVTDNQGKTASVTKTVTVKPSDDVGWVSPVGFEDPSRNWKYPERAFDNDLSTYAYHSTQRGDWTSYLFLDAPEAGLLSDRIRFQIDDSLPSGHGFFWQFDVYRDGAWVNIYEGTPDERTWVEVAFDEGTVTQLRFRARNDTSGQWRVRVWEVDLRDDTIPLP